AGKSDLEGWTKFSKFCTALPSAINQFAILNGISPALRSGARNGPTLISLGLADFPSDWRLRLSREVSCSDWNCSRAMDLAILSVGRCQSGKTCRAAIF